MARVVYLNGSFVPEHEARISIYDSAVLAGDMAFEVTRTCRHKPFRLEAHLDRLFHSLSVLRIDPGVSRAELLEISLETLARNLQTAGSEIDWNLMHNISRGPSPLYAQAFSPDEPRSKSDPVGRWQARPTSDPVGRWQARPTVIVNCFPLDRKMASMAAAYETGVDLVVPAQRAIPSSLWDATIKTRSRAHYQLAGLQAAERLPGAMALLVEPAGWLTETTTGNVFLVHGDTLSTPRGENILQGVTREVVLDLATRLGIDWREANLTTADAQCADEVFVSSTSIGILPVRMVNASRIAHCPGPVTHRLQSALWQELGLDLAEQARQYASRS